MDICNKQTPPWGNTLTIWQISIWFTLDHKTSLFSNKPESREGQKIMSNSMSNELEPISPLLYHNDMSIVNMELKNVLTF